MSPNFFVYTFSMGRWKYLERCIKSVSRERLQYSGAIRHVVFLQGVDLPASYWHLTQMATFIKFEHNIGIANGINIAMKSVGQEIIMKMDDDCEIIGVDFFRHAANLANKFPDLIFSPYPVGLIGNPGGVKGIDHLVHCQEDQDLFYTLRWVNHVGGLCRISPNLTKNWTLLSDLGIESASGNEDLQFSHLASSLGLKMAYLENSLIVEHQESTLGQHQRYGSNYFSGRF